jgi:hypothetical protein
MGLKKGPPVPNRAPRALPSLSNQSEIIPYLQKLRTTVNKSVRQPQVPAAVLNFTITKSKTGFQLTWSAVPGCDGYVVYKSPSGSFNDAEQIMLRNAQQTSWMDSSDSLTVRYKIASTAGTDSQPQSITSALSPSPLTPTVTGSSASSGGSTSAAAAGGSSGSGGSGSTGTDTDAVALLTDVLIVNGPNEGELLAFAADSGDNKWENRTADDLRIAKKWQVPLLSEFFS